MKKIILAGIMAVTGLMAQQVVIEEHTKIYEVPLQYSATIKGIENKGVLQKEYVKKVDNENTIDKKQVLIYFKNNYTDERKFQILLSILTEMAKNKNIQNKQSTLETLQVLQQLHGNK